MKKFENVHEVVSELAALNDPQLGLLGQAETDTDGNEVERPITAKELQELNYRDIVELCDLLGINDICLIERKENN